MELQSNFFFKLTERGSGIFITWQQSFVKNYAEPMNAIPETVSVPEKVMRLVLLFFKFRNVISLLVTNFQGCLKAQPLKKVHLPLQRHKGHGKALVQLGQLPQ
jgi:hypothetical protein